jgi:PAS domain S-box-containing protein
MQGEPKASILLVDDERANLLALEVVLEPLGQELVRAYSGREALKALTERDFAVVLLDVRMGGLNGIETARIIRNNPWSAHTPIIFLTAYEANHDSIQQAYELHAVDYLVKPLIPAVVRSKVAVFVDLYQKTERLRRSEEHQRLRAERAVHEGEEQFRQLADFIPHLAWIARHDGYVFWFNHRWYEYTGTTLNAVQGWGWKSVYDIKHLPRIMTKFKRALQTSEPWEDTVPLKRQDGVMRWHLSRVLPIRNDEGEVVRWFGTHTDITEEREAICRKDLFLAALADELAKPLAPLTTGLHVLRGSSPVLTGESVHGMMDRQLQRLSRVIRNLLDVSQISQGTIRLKRERFDLARLVRSVVEGYQPLIEQARLTLEKEIPETPLWISGDSIRLTQVISNLLLNAINFSIPGGRVTIRVNTDQDQHSAVVAVEDEGIGIEPDKLPGLFEAFQRMDRNGNPTRAGLGLGLALVRGIVKLHGGDVTASSAGPGRGAKFTVNLTLLEEPAALVQAPLPIPKTERRSRVLIIEDNRDAADSLRQLLSMLGHVVRVAYNGRDGLDVAREWAPEVIVCDIGLPELDGYQVARELRRDPLTAQSRLLALTGYGQEEDQRRSKEAGFDVHLVKPADPDQLQELLMG